MSFVTRFAPSPTGWLHLGHAYAALTAFDAARAVGGRFLLRIEDTDFTRRRPEFESAIYEDLSWLGLSWEEPVRRQSEHGADYAAALDHLRDLGVLYRCFRTRREVLAAIAGAPQDGDPEDVLAFSGTSLPSADEALRLGHGEPFAWSMSVKAAEAAKLERGEAFAWRLSLKAAEAAVGGFDRLTWVEEGEGAGVLVADPWPLGDLVLGRKDIGAGYNMAVVIDDALQGVTHVVRGVDLQAVTSVHRLLQALLGLPTPVYRHHRLLTGPDGRRLAKRNGGTPLREFREEGVTVQEIRVLIGLPPGA